MFDQIFCKQIRTILSPIKTSNEDILPDYEDYSSMTKEELINVIKLKDEIIKFLIDLDLEV